MRSQFRASSLVALTIAAAAAVALLQPVHAQTPDTAAPDAPLLHLDVRRVPVDIVVLDHQGNPVKGLTARDFTIKEDGKPQAIATFDATDGSAPSFIPPKLPPLPANTFVDVPTQPERGPLYILYYDMVNTPMEDQANFHAQLLKFIDNAQPGVRMALFVNAAGLHLLQGFTSDHALLRAAVLSKGPGPHMPQVFTMANTYGASDWGAALSNLKFMAEYVDGLQGRKNLLWLASNFPIPVGPTMVGSAAIPTASTAPVSGQIGVGGGPQALDLYALAPETIKQSYAAMMHAQVALYPISLRGVGGAEDPNGAADTVADFQNMDNIAQYTGGRAYHGDNRIAALVDQAVSHGESFYTISYAPSNLDSNGGERHIQVTMTGGQQYALTYRTLYYPDGDHAKIAFKRDVRQDRLLAAKAEDTLYANIEHGAPMLHDLLFSAHFAATGKPTMATTQQMQALEDSPAFFRTRRKDKAPKPLTPVKLQKYTIDYGVVDPQLKAEASRNGAPATVEFAAAAYDQDGKLLNSELNQGQATVDKRQEGKQQDGKPSSTFRAQQQIEVPPGATSIRVVVRDKATNRTGSLEVTLPLAAENGKQSAK